MQNLKPDVVIVGGGLAGCLLALRLAQTKPHLTITIFDRNAELAGDQLWSLHATDVPEASLSWLRPLMLKTWPSQDISFPGRSRAFSTEYCTISSRSVRQALERETAIHSVAGVDIIELTGNAVKAADGRVYCSDLVIDARGYRPMPEAVNAYQKFLGRVVSIAGGHGVINPLIMDAGVDQIDGFRFVYLLPLDDQRIMVEDTRYSDHGLLDLESMEDGVQSYIDAKGWQVASEEHREQGVLPITLFYDAQTFWNNVTEGPVPIGMRAGLFHATTGYSLPLAVEIADLIASQNCLNSAAILPLIRDFALAHARRQTYFRYLNRMMFRGCPPERRWIIMRRFYGLRQRLIERFYADRLLLRDRLRILTGKPPIPIYQGIRCMPEVRDLNPVAA